MSLAYLTRGHRERQATREPRNPRAVPTGNLAHAPAWSRPLSALPPAGLFVGGARLQAQLEVGAVDDPLEREADQVAEQVLRMPDPMAVSPRLSHAGAGPVRRACTCGGAGDGECAGCAAERVQGKAAGAGSEAGIAAPAIVDEVLGSPGQCLDATTRAFMEPRFGLDLSGVRVHTDTRAAESARALGALAYAVGHNVVFAGGRYQPEAESGRRLIAHELAHTAQQGAATATPEQLSLGERGSSQERQADQAAMSVLSGEAPQSLTSEGLLLRRDDADPIPIDLVPVSDEENEELKKRRINLPSVSKATWRLIGGRADNAGETLSNAEVETIKKILTTAGITTGTPVAGTVTGPKFLMHDTSSPVGATSIKKEADIGKGPLGKGVAGWVPRDTAATIARPDFYETKRPSTTEFEKGIDFITQADREAALKDIWKITKVAEKGPALDRALAGTGLDAAQITSIKTGAESFFLGAADKDLPDGSKSAAAWAVGELCSKAGRDGTATVAANGKDTDFDAICKKLAKYFTERSARVSSIVPVEIVQVGAKPGVKGVVNTCDPTNPDVQPMPSPPYSDNQYTNIVLLYLRAAFIAGRFPEVTTHFVVDSFERGHCDPRCFDLQKLYDSIALTLGHGKGSTYGVKPSYGMKWGRDTIWWDNGICGGPHP